MKHKKHEKKRKAPSNPLKPHHQSKVSKSGSTLKSQKKKANSGSSSRPIIPFEPTDSILLVGEGDFSFTNALLTNSLISPTTVLTTSTNDSEPATYEKYPQSTSIIEDIKSRGHRVLFNVDVTKNYPKGIRKQNYDAVIFNFPHTGGLTTDVDRQIRANQELLLSFIQTTRSLLTPTGTLVITLFEGAPYNQWNIRELAKSCGMQCRRSFKFDTGLYEGYKHARTIGNREREGDWKGEERGARTFIFEAVSSGRKVKSRKKNEKVKAKAKEESSDEDK